VALRRLRAALKLFRRALPCPQFEALGDEARRIASAFGPTRDCDAFLETAAAGPLAQADQPAGCEALQAWVEGRRAAAFGDVRALVEDLGTTRFVLDLRSLLARRAWRNALDGAELARLTGPAEEFAQATLDRLHAKALKRGKKLAGMPDAARHELRITLKTLRYGAEFFGALFGGRRRVGRYVETVSALQDLLGAHNDAAGARRLLDETPPDTERASGFVLGWFARGSTLAEAELAAAWKRFRKADLFWR
jgi:CHAD domain-containing protein